MLILWPIPVSLCVSELGDEHSTSLTRLQTRYPEAQVRLTAGHVAMATCAIVTVGKAPLLLFLSAVLFVTYIGPMWLLLVQKYKRTIRGPWDEAIVPGTRD